MHIGLIHSIHSSLTRMRSQPQRAKNVKRIESRKVVQPQKPEVREKRILFPQSGQKPILSDYTVCTFVYSTFGRETNSFSSQLSSSSPASRWSREKEEDCVTFICSRRHRRRRRRRIRAMTPRVLFRPPAGDGVFICSLSLGDQSPGFG